MFILRPLLEEADFVSVGTNDLVQYLLAADRDNPWVAKLYDPQHPAVWRALSLVAEASRAAKKPCAVCGEMAGDYATALLLLGLGYDSVSVVPQLLPEVKLAVRETPYPEARDLAAEVILQDTSQGVGKVLGQARERLHRRHLSEGAEEAALEGSDAGSGVAGPTGDSGGDRR